MIGRGTRGRPWHAGVLAGRAAPDLGDIAEIAVEHYEMMLEFYGEAVGLRHSRKHLGWYLDRYATTLAAEKKTAIMTATDSRVVIQHFREALGADCGVASNAREAA